MNSDRYLMNSTIAILVLIALIAGVSGFYLAAIPGLLVASVMRVLMFTQCDGGKIGILWQPGALWIGAHYSPYCKRWCINFLPCITLWIAAKDGKIPHSTR